MKESYDCLGLLTFVTPLIFGLFICLYRNSLSYRMLGTLGVIGMGCTAVGSAILVYQASRGWTTTVELLQLLSLPGMSCQILLRLDIISCLMLFVISIVSAVVHCYSIAYMAEDASRGRFLGYLSLFTFSMFILVTAGDFVQLFIGWEGVGLFSYLLIGFWFEKPTAVQAAKKAFIVNRVSDIGLALGILTIGLHGRSLSFDDILSSERVAMLANQQLGLKWPWLGVTAELDVLTLGCALLFFGCMGKSAQLGLHVWLPDAMEGPTPVSALIHAATMVTAGVFLLVRLSPLFAAAPELLSWIVGIGTATSFMAATIALRQNDIKKIIAYSTCSQLGYMFAACGSMAFGAAMFHLATHAFFKALLFLGAGSVIHGLHGEQDIRKMGKLAREMPFTCWMMVLGSAALIGIFPLAGFYSKDAILEAMYLSGVVAGESRGDSGSGLAYWSGLITALMTAVYSTRLLYLVFFGRAAAGRAHAHEAPALMRIPMVVLAVGSICAGWCGDRLGMAFGGQSFWFEVIAPFPLAELREQIPHAIEWLPLAVGLAGIALTLFRYSCISKGPSCAILRPSPHTETLGVQQVCRSGCPISSFLTNLLQNGYFFDQAYDMTLKRPLARLSHFLTEIVERLWIDGLVRHTYHLISRLSHVQSRGHTGHLSHYLAVALLFTLGMIYYQSVAMILAQFLS